MNSRRLLAALPLILLACSAPAARPEQPRRDDSAPSKAASKASSEDASKDLVSFLDAERVAQKLPGLGVVIVRSDGPPRVYVSGERRIGKGDPMTPADRMHLGSLTKAITATVISALVEKRSMTFETTLGDTFPELSAKMQPAYRNVSVRQVLAHRAGIEPYRTNLTFLPLLTLKGTPREQRAAFVEQVLALPPRFEPGTKREYSNGGGALAGAMAERIGGAPYGELVEQLVFAPLGGHAAFGNPGLAAAPQPWGHVRSFLGAVTEVAPAAPAYTTPVAMEAAGDASPTMQDYGRFLQLHLRGLRGRDDVLKATTIQELHGIVGSNSPAEALAMGWAIMPRAGVESHEHVGSSGAYVAFATIQPSRDVALAAFTNMGGGQDLRNAVGSVALQIATRIAAAEPPTTRD